MPSIVSGKLTEIIYARLEPHEDLRPAIIRIIKEKQIKSGVVLSITGALEYATLQHFHEVGAPTIPMGTIKVPGPLEASGHGIIGIVDAPAFGKKPFTMDEFVHGEPYLHVHLTVTSAKETVCGHLMPGTPIRAIHPTSHFTIVLAKVEGAQIKLTGEPGHEPGAMHFGHELVQW
ncbi:MAG: DNA-binding protein [Dehalococcoidales bacterium]|nr:DNA-binding protein [Dehalococcoidales bacterium]